MASMCVFMGHHLIINSCPFPCPTLLAPLATTWICCGCCCCSYLPCHLLEKFFLIASPPAVCLFFAYASSSFFRSFHILLPFSTGFPFSLFIFYSAFCSPGRQWFWHFTRICLLCFSGQQHWQRGKGQHFPLFYFSFFCIYKCVRPCIHRNRSGP